MAKLQKLDISFGLPALKGPGVVRLDWVAEGAQRAADDLSDEYAAMVAQEAANALSDTFAAQMEEEARRIRLAKDERNAKARARRAAKAASLEPMEVAA